MRFSLFTGVTSSLMLILFSLEIPILFQPDTDFQSLDGIPPHPDSWLEMPLSPDRPVPFRCAVSVYLEMRFYLFFLMRNSHRPRSLVLLVSRDRVPFHISLSSRRPHARRLWLERSRQTQRYQYVSFVKSLSTRRPHSLPRLLKRHRRRVKSQTRLETTF